MATVLRLTVYLTYLIVVLALFLRPTRARARPTSGAEPSAPQTTPERSTT